MFLKKLDFLSPDITLYHKGDLSHSSWMSGILSLIQATVVIVFGIYFFLDFTNHREPKAYFYNRFIEDAGLYQINSSSFFHFLSISSEENSVNEFDFDFLSFRVIGLDSYFVNYLNDKNLTNRDHWLYGRCSNLNISSEIDTLLNSKGLRNYEYFQNYACINKFYDSKTGKYYNIGEGKFHWPNISFGLANPNRTYYSIIVEKCSQNELDEIFEKGKYKCKSDEQMKKTIDGYHAFHMNFVNHDVDVLDYKEPNKKYFYNVENAIDMDNYSINHINFNPILISTHDGIAFDESREEMTYTFDRNDEFTYNGQDSGIYCIYNLWLKNRMQCFDRAYKKIQDVISEIGGVAQGITYVAVFLNCLFNKYKAISNVEKIIFPFLKFEEINGKVGTNKKLDELSKKMKKVESNTNLYNNFDINIPTNEIKTTSSNNDDACINDTISNKYKNNETQIVSKEDELKTRYYFLLKKKFNFWQYRWYKFTCGKKYSYFKEYENFRIKIISEENIIKNHLNICNLLKFNGIIGINRNFLLADLLKD